MTYSIKIHRRTTDYEIVLLSMEGSQALLSKIYAHDYTILDRHLYVYDKHNNTIAILASLTNDIKVIQ